MLAATTAAAAVAARLEARDALFVVESRMVRELLLWRDDV
jgi:hypothetical protein